MLKSAVKIALLQTTFCLPVMHQEVFTAPGKTVLQRLLNLNVTGHGIECALQVSVGALRKRTETGILARRVIRIRA